MDVLCYNIKVKMNTKLKSFIQIAIICFVFIQTNAQSSIKTFQNAQIKVGAECFNQYIKLLKNKNVGMVVNQTSIVGKYKTHIVDTLIKQGIKIQKIYAPEHGFRGDADAGEKVDNTVDAKTGISIISIYGKKTKPDSQDLKNIDVLVFDIQDVGARFYTYISTLQYILEAGAQNKIPVIVLDRPNPNGHYVDGSILEKPLKSFIGMQPVPIVYGMTMGEYGQMLNTEGWLENAVKCQLTVIKCKGYDHRTFYELPIKPSPNIPTARAVYLYPSICFFEGTDASVGRGTEKQFQIYGSPNFPKEKATFEFTPMPNEGAKKPFHENEKCYGFDLTALNMSSLQNERKINLTYLLDYYKNFPNKDSFFLKNNFFDKLAGNTLMQQQIKDGKSEAEMRASWKEGLDNFKKIRKKYLLYRDFK